MDALLLRAFAHEGMYLASRCLAMGLYVTLYWYINVMLYTLRIIRDFLRNSLIHLSLMRLKNIHNISLI
jgi:hypothetical protein